MKLVLTVLITVFSLIVLRAQIIMVDQYPTPLDLNNECILSSPETHPDVINYFQNSGYGSATSSCGTITVPWPIENITWSEYGCGSWDADVEWRVEDDCGNYEIVNSNIHIMEDSHPYFSTQPSDITINCGDPNNQAILDNWLDNVGGGVVTFPCSPLADTLVNYIPYQMSCPTNGSMQVHFEIISCNGPGSLGYATVHFSSTIIEFSATNVSYGEDVVNAQFCLDTNLEIFDDVDVELTLQGSSTATNGSDFGPVQTVSTYTIMAGPAGTHCFDVPLLEDMMIEPDETIVMKITAVNSPSSLEIIGPDNEVIITIADNDDNDFDGIGNTTDNCVDNYNPFQEDIDDDGIGDVCDSVNTVSQAAEIADNLYLNKVYSGVILTDQSGNCWMITVQLNGELKTTNVTCPN